MGKAERVMVTHQNPHIFTDNQNLKTGEICGHMYFQTANIYNLIFVIRVECTHNMELFSGSPWNLNRCFVAPTWAGEHNTQKLRTPTPWYLHTMTARV